jgi:hypothetical protein
VKTKTYDSRCYELAEVFLQDEAELNTEEKKEQLAIAIQEAIEDEIHWMKIHKELGGT